MSKVEDLERFNVVIEKNSGYEWIEYPKSKRGELVNATQAIAVIRELEARLEAYERPEYALVRREDLENSISALTEEVRQYDLLWEGRAERLARYDEERQSLARLQAALTDTKE